MTTKILGPRPSGVLAKAPLDIGGNAGIERIVRAEDDVDLPVHVRLLVAVSHTCAPHECDMYGSMQKGAMASIDSQNLSSQLSIISTCLYNPPQRKLLMFHC